MVLSLLANAVETTITAVAASGLGDVTLGSGVGDNLTPAQAGFTDGPGVAYRFEETNGDYESGIGHFTTSQTIFVRDNALEKQVGTAREYLPATKLTVTTGGKFRMGPNALMQFAGYRPWQREFTVNYDTCDNFGGLGTLTWVPTADRFQAVAYALLHPRKIAKFGIDVTTLAGSSTNTRAGLYGSNPDGSPGDLIIDSGDIDVSTAGIKLIAAASWAVGGTSEIILPPGLYYAGVVTNDTALRVAGTSSSLINWGGSISTNDNRRKRGATPYMNSVSGALPSSFTVNQDKGSSVPVPVHQSQ